jgi:hypothetical protein
LEPVRMCARGVVIDRDLAHVVVQVGRQLAHVAREHGIVAAALLAAVLVPHFHAIARPAQPDRRDSVRLALRERKRFGRRCRKFERVHAQQRPLVVCVLVQTHDTAIVGE